MKFSQMGRFTLASLSSLAVCLGLIACTRDYTVAYVYATSTKSNPGLVNVYHVDFQSGSLMQLSDSPVSSGGKNPVGLVVTNSQKSLFVINRDDSNIVWYQIGTDGKIYAQKTYSTAGSFPVALAISSDDKFLYVVCTYQGTSSTGPGIINVFQTADDATNNDYSLTPLTALNTNVGVTPIGVVASTNATTTATATAPATTVSFLYVIEQDTTTTSNLLGFSRNTTTGALTALAGTTVTATAATGYSSGVLPSSIVEDPKARYLYVTDRSANQVIGYTFSSGGVPTPMNNGPFATGSLPVAATIDPRGKFLYVANYNANTVTPFAIDISTGSLSASSGSTGTATGTGPTCVTIESALGIYLFTSNQLDNSVTGLQLNPSTGALKNIQNTPFPASGLPSCAAAVANGDHATQIVQ
ncbi:lactonase family protein [Terriglobus saanensis]|uniref:Putative lipoprotein n=1 Tax=Terriglobus saanensis (strain ATCC BAA-1853 / DSM 23119 / SP1PR4) TaxID=401053 RepID=E8V5M7_TERSS|nr:beta-propeller fold lactonase family protein [Terriglobus saanensis]ADV81561.1 putative lipoprotein [Terriglobus saanensis SP1PR4]